MQPYSLNLVTHFLAIDDTDNIDGGGTGRVARSLATWLGADVTLGVSRHQLLVDPRVPYTRNNSSNCLHLRLTDADPAELAEGAIPQLLEQCLPGSDPGLCVVRADAVAGHDFGRRAQTDVLSQALALEEAERLGVWLRPLGGTGDGVVGALAAVCLAASGNDGRFVHLGGIRDLPTRVAVEDILAAGVSAVHSPDGRPIATGWIDTMDRVRPVLRDGQAILLVEPGETPGEWRVVRQGKHRPDGEQPSDEPSKEVTHA